MSHRHPSSHSPAPCRESRRRWRDATPWRLWGDRWFRRCSRCRECLRGQSAPPAVVVFPPQPGRRGSAASDLAVEPEHPACQAPKRGGAHLGQHRGKLVAHEDCLGLGMSHAEINVRRLERAVYRHQNGARDCPPRNRRTGNRHYCGPEWRSGLCLPSPGAPVRPPNARPARQRRGGKMCPVFRYNRGPLGIKERIAPHTATENQGAASLGNSTSASPVATFRRVGFAPPRRWSPSAILLSPVSS